MMNIISNGFLPLRDRYFGSFYRPSAIADMQRECATPHDTFSIDMIPGVHRHLNSFALIVNLKVIIWRIDNRKSLYFNHSIEADNNRKLKLKISNAIIPVVGICSVCMFVVINSAPLLARNSPPGRRHLGFVNKKWLFYVMFDTVPVDYWFIALLFWGSLEVYQDKKPKQSQPITEI